MSLTVKNVDLVYPIIVVMIIIINEYKYKY